jgi:hypothetical protein
MIERNFLDLTVPEIHQYMLIDSVKIGQIGQPFLFKAKK